MENLQRHTVSGLRHICDLLGAPESEDDTHVTDMVSWTREGTKSVQGVLTGGILQKSLTGRPVFAYL